MSAQDVVALVKEVANRAPLLVIVDEMGKNLEFAAGNRSVGDLHLLQLLAESITRTDGAPVFFFTLQHLSFDDYSAAVSNRHLQEWAKVQGRFEDVPFAESREQVQSLISSVMEIDAAPRGFPTMLAGWSKRANETCMRLGLADLLSSRGTLGAAYPLHPLALLVLPELAARFGQHDRSVFTFLTGPERFSVPRFLSAQAFDANQSLPWVGLDRVYDYFVESLGGALAASTESSRWLEIQAAIRETGGLNEDELRCLKVVGVLNLVSTAGPLRASAEMIQFALNGPEADSPKKERSRAALRALEDRGILTLRDFAGEYRIWQGSDVDVRGLLKRERERIASVGLAEQLAAVVPLPPLIARRHSSRVGSLRYFERRFVDAESLDPEDLVCSDSTADGLILYAFGRPPTGFNAPPRTNNRRPLLLCWLDEVESLRDASLEAAATRSLLNSRQHELDPVARREVRHRAIVAEASLRERLEEAIAPANPRIDWLANGRPVRLRSGRELSALLSELCDKGYPQSPRLHNEMLNRRDLTSQGAKARRVLVEAMIGREIDERLGLEGHGPERSMYESALASPGLHQARGNRFGFGDPPRRSGLRSVWLAIQKFFDSAIDKQRPLSELYAELMGPPYGLKEGPVPVLLVAALLNRSEDVCIYQEGSFQPALTAEFMERLVKTPERFSVKVADVRGVRQSVLIELTRGLMDSAPTVPQGWRNAALLSVVRELARFARNLPEYTLKSKELSAEGQAVRSALTTSKEPDQLIFYLLPEACGLPPFEERARPDDVAVGEFRDSLARAIRELAQTYEGLLGRVRGRLGDVLGSGGAETIREGLRVRSRQILNQVIDPRLRSFLLTASNEDFDDREWLEALAMNLTEKPPSVWLDEDEARFEASLVEIARRFHRVELLHLEMRDEIREGFDARRITVTSADGRELGRVAWMDQSKAVLTQQLVEETFERVDRTLGPDGREALLAALAEKILGETTTMPPEIRFTGVRDSEGKEGIGG